MPRVIKNNRNEIIFDYSGLSSVRDQFAWLNGLRSSNLLDSYSQDDRELILNKARLEAIRFGIVLKKQKLYK